jgi:formylglycine-generating enzyme required for sulfatase activity
LISLRPLIDKKSAAVNSVAKFWTNMMIQPLKGLRGAMWMAATGLACAATALAFVYQTDRELVATGDFDGDGRQDVVILDHATGKYRLGYQEADGSFKWVNYRLSGVIDATGLTVGRFLDPKKDALLVLSADATQLNLIDASDRGMTSKAVSLPFNLLGPSVAAPVNLGAAPSAPQDLLVASIYNDPTPNKISLIRNDGGKFEDVVAETDAPDRLTMPNPVALKAGGPQVVAGMWTTAKAATFRVVDYHTGKAQVLVEAAGLPKDADYVVGHFRGRPLPEVILYQKGTNTVTIRAIEEDGGAFKLGEAKTADLGKPVRLAIPAGDAPNERLVILFGKGESAEVFKLDDANTPVSIQTIAAKPGDLLFGAVGVGKTLLMLTGPDYSKFSSDDLAFQWSGSTYAGGAAGKLASLADNDDATVPDIRKFIVDTLAMEHVTSAADMRAYTNTIPGSKVEYAMVPIPGGEYVMGSPDSEKGRAADEGPQHKVKISPFWMGKCEITWNEYELFMYPDDEKKLRADNPTEEYINKVSDAVTRPSKPYMEMSFGMGKDGYPAISMTQHAANKYCQWLSAKTGHFYRLPTEAEWEYACRAGTTTAYSFGDDASKLGDYAWFEDNSDFKYQKVGKKKPNPWGLYDMHGNVAEWCLDQYEPNYDKFVGQMAVDPWIRATKPYPHSVRGGSYDDEAAKLRSAARRFSDKSWKMRDPQLPKSIWWLTDAQFLGFRIVRPLAVPSAEALQKYWTSGVEKDN